jgi:hypothetical protein
MFSLFNAEKNICIMILNKEIQDVTKVIGICTPYQMD